MSVRHSLVCISVSLLALGAHVVLAQSYPNKPIRIVAAQAGGVGDFASRLVAQGLSASLGEQVIVDNRGSTGVVAAELVAKAAPDGYTLLCYGSNIWLLPFLDKNIPYDPVRDFTPITFVTRSPSILVVHPALPVRTVKELIALAKSRQGELSYAAGGIGGTPHIAAELFKSMAGINIVRINYKSEGPAIIDLLGGHVQIMFASASSSMPHVKSGRLKALAIASAQPSELVPGLPTVASSGLPGYELSSVIACFAPAKTPAAIINRLNQEVVRYLNQPDVKARLFKSGVEGVGTSPEESVSLIKLSMDKLGKVIRGAGIRAN